MKKPKRKDGGHWDNEYPARGGICWKENKNMVCFDCRLIKRVRIGASGKFLCPQCKKQLHGMWCKIRLPKKSNIKAWEKLKKEHDWKF